MSKQKIKQFIIAPIVVAASMYLIQGCSPSGSSSTTTSTPTPPPSPIGEEPADTKFCRTNAGGCPLTQDPGGRLTEVKDREDKLRKRSEETARRDEVKAGVRVAQETLNNTAQYLNLSIETAISDAKKIGGEEGKEIVLDLQKLQKACDTNIGLTYKATQKADKKIGNYDTNAGKNSEAFTRYEGKLESLAKHSQKLQQNCKDRLTEIRQEIRLKEAQRRTVIEERSEGLEAPTYNEIMRKKSRSPSPSP